MSKIVLSHIDKFYGENHVLRDINLTIEDGDFVVLVTYKDGWYTKEEDAKAIIKDKLPAEDVSPILSYEDAMDYIEGNGDTILEANEDTEYINLETGKSFTLKAGESIADHSSSLKDKGFILICDDNFNIIQVLLVDGKNIQTSGL